MPGVVSIVYEDSDFFFVNKPAGMVVAGLEKDTEEICFHDQVKDYAIKMYKYWPGLLQRLDRGTSGLMVYAKVRLQCPL